MAGARSKTRQPAATDKLFATPEELAAFAGDVSSGPTQRGAVVAAAVRC